jgi:hypothetical protein
LQRALTHTGLTPASSKARIPPTAGQPSESFLVRREAGLTPQGTNRPRIEPPPRGERHRAARGEPRARQTGRPAGLASASSGVAPWGSRAPQSVRYAGPAIMREPARGK